MFVSPRHVGRRQERKLEPSTIFSASGLRKVDSWMHLKQWIKANVGAVMKIFSSQHQIQREELFLGRWHADIFVILGF